MSLLLICTLHCSIRLHLQRERVIEFKKKKKATLVIVFEKVLVLLKTSWECQENFQGVFKEPHI